MKRLIYILPLIFALAACDNIGKDDRYIEIEQVTAQRRVLLEEFTGQRCTNCPAAHAIIEKLEEQYGSDLIVVSIHAGNFGIPAPGGLMQPEGDQYASRWDITAYPAGVVDRKAPVLNSDSWATAIRDEIGKTTSLNIDLEASVTPDGDKIDVLAELYSSDAVDGSLQLWVVENGIVGFQIDGGNRLQDYVHNNVFRACVNGLWGESVSVPAATILNYDYALDIDSSWNTDNLYIVGFVYNAGGVVQVNKCKVKNQ